MASDDVDGHCFLPQLTDSSMDQKGPKWNVLDGDLGGSDEIAAGRAGG